VAGGAVAIVPAAGVGSRLGTGLKKPFFPLMGKPLIVWALLALEGAEEIAEIIPVLKDSDMERGAEFLKQYGLSKVRHIASGGHRRQDSVLSGLRLVADPSAVVLVHDGARPLLEHGLIKETLEALDGYDGAVAAVSCTDTIKEASAEGVVLRTLDRQVLWAAQTPQVFPFGRLMEAHEAAASKGYYSTDDSALVQWRGGRIRIVKGSTTNIKITTPEDIEVAETFMRRLGWVRGSGA
jgi:2-C-methyl-D-erythritol 4-phosphate cytidylyltransferase